jgi:glutamine synthetase
VIFNGNNYSAEWPKEAARRGLPNVTNAVDALKAFITDKSLKLFEKYEVLSHKEMHSRYDIYVETYAKQIHIEAMAAIDMVKKQFIPAVAEYGTFLAESIASFKAAAVSAPVQEDLLKKLGALLASAYKNLGKLEVATAKARETAGTVKKAETYRDRVATAMQVLRTDIDALEMIVPGDMWPVPTYADLLFKL